MNKRMVILNISRQISQLTEKDQEEINEFLEHDEWGIALEIICSILLEKDIVISIAIYNSIKNISEAMEMDPSTWEDLIHLVR